MAFKTLSGGLQLVIPVTGTTNWGPQTESGAWQKINDHRHTGSGDGNKLLADSLTDNIIDKSKMAVHIAGYQAATLTPAGTTETIDFDNGNKQVLDLSSASGDVTLTLSNPIEGADYRIRIDQGATLRNLIWPAAVLFPQGEEPSQYMEVNTTAVVWLDYDGTNYLCRWELDLS